MIRGLRRRFFLLCAGMTGAVLLVLTGVLDITMERECRERSLREQQEVFSLLQGRLQEGKLVEDAWLGRLERENRLIISILDNGAPLYFSGGWQPETPRAELLRQAQQLSGEEPFLIAGRGESYRCLRAAPGPQQEGYELTLLFSLWAEQREIGWLRMRFFLTGAAGLAALTALSAALARLATRRAEENLREQRAFVAAASHELRSPLAALGASAAAILADPPGTERYVQAITGECGRLGRLTDDLLLLTRADTPGFSLQSAPVDLDTLLIETAERLLLPLRERGHALRLSLPDEEALPAVFGDGFRLRQAIENLLLNAVCYAGGEEEILLLAARAGKMVHISVIDHGAGIADDEKRRVFERFARGDRARSDRSHSGLGLSIVQEIARLHGGRVTLTDTPGGGCTFTLCLPVSKYRANGANGRCMDEK